LVDRISAGDLNHFISELTEIDLKIKTTDLNTQTLLERFLFHYCQLRKGARITSKARD
jgi:hypothetical protein